MIDEEIQPDRIIDATLLSGNPQVFRDHIHFVEEGADALSAFMAEGLSDYIAGLTPEGNQ